jgi:Aconitase family (aconitate hydratase)
VVGPEQGLTLPRLLIVCGDSHTSTHGALSAYAFGIGASEVAHALMTQTLWQRKPKRMRITITGRLSSGIAAKDMVLAIIASIGADGATGHAIEFAGPAIRTLSMEGRLTLCNMSIEAGARSGMIAPDETTFEYVKGRPYSPKGKAFDQAIEAWSVLTTDEGAKFNREVELNAADIAPIVTWGTSPQDALPIDASVPDPAREPDAARAKYLREALRLLHVRRDQRRCGAARGALRVDHQSQFRWSTRTRRAHPFDVSGHGRGSSSDGNVDGRPAAARGTQSLRRTWTSSCRLPARHRQSQHRSTAPGALSEVAALGRTWNRAAARSALRCRRARAARFSAQPAGLARRQDYRGRPQLRLRLFPRGGGLCALRLRHSMRDRAILRRHFCRQCGAKGLLTAIISDDEAATLMTVLGEKPGQRLTVDLEQQTIQCGDQIFRFAIDPVRGTRLLNGWDNITLTESYRDKVAAFKAADRGRRRWATPSH